jgi:hypothetical protein
MTWLNTAGHRPVIAGMLPNDDAIRSGQPK